MTTTARDFVKLDAYRQAVEPYPVLPREVLDADPQMTAAQAQALIAERAEARCQIADRIFGGHMVRPAEEAAATHGKAIFGGSTHAHLTAVYGNRVRHVVGVGWFLDLPED